MKSKQAIAALLLSAALAACSPAPSDRPGPAGTRVSENRRQAVTVQVETAKVGNLTVDNTTAGLVVPETQSSVAAGTAGTVKALVCRAGDWVEAGAPVIQLDDGQFQLSLKISRTNLRNAEVTAGMDGGVTVSTSKVALQLNAAQKSYAAAQALDKIGAISSSDLDTAQAALEAARMAVRQSSIAVDAAQLQVQQAELNLGAATIRAPYAGQIAVINVRPGEYVGPSTTAFGLVSRKKVISFSVAPSDASGLGPGTKVKFTAKGRAVSALINQAPSAPVGGLVTLTADAPDHLDSAFGTVGEVSYSLVQANGVLIPLPALQSAENKTFVFTVKGGKAARVEVAILAESGTYAVVAGLPEGATVILNPPPGLLVGAAVEAVEPTAGES
jgi:RND family efflux transporter MFP subunit